MSGAVRRVSALCPDSLTRRRKTSFEVDFAKVGAALDEIVKREQRKVLLQMLSSGVLELNNPEVMAGAWR